MKLCHSENLENIYCFCHDESSLLSSAGTKLRSALSFSRALYRHENVRKFDKNLTKIC